MIPNAIPLQRLTLGEEIATNILDNLHHLVFTNRFTITSIFTSPMADKAYNPVLQLGVLFNIIHVEAQMLKLDTEKKLEKTVHKALTDAWESLILDGERFYMLIKHPIFEKCLTETVYTQREPIKPAVVPSAPKGP